MNLRIEESWEKFLTDEFEKPYFIDLQNFVKTEHQSKVIYPPVQLIFNAFEKCPVHKTKVVIIGQDPYHGQNQAHGLSFSVMDGVPFPPSLKNIFKELYADLGIIPPLSGNLERWAEQGVLMLNATLTVQSKNAGSHQNRGWETFTDTVIEKLAAAKENLVFVLWGAYAQKKGAKIDSSKHFIISSAHPSPFSAHSGFFGSKPFSKTNEFLNSKKIECIKW